MRWGKKLTSTTKSRAPVTSVLRLAMLHSMYLEDASFVGEGSIQSEEALTDQLTRTGFTRSMQFLKPRLACPSFQIPRSQYLVRLHKSGRASRTVTMASNIADEARPVEGKVVVIPDASEEQILGLGVRSWPTWSCEASVFPWTYSMGNETCYLLEGEVTVTPEGGEPTSFKAGDIVSFPRDMKCTWDVKAAVLKHYTFF